MTGFSIKALELSYNILSQINHILFAKLYHHIAHFAYGPIILDDASFLHLKNLLTDIVEQFCCYFFVDYSIFLRCTQHCGDKVQNFLFRKIVFIGTLAKNLT